MVSRSEKYAKKRYIFSRTQAVVRWRAQTCNDAGLVEGAGFEPAKPVGRQIYSLLVLATHPPLHVEAKALY